MNTVIQLRAKGKPVVFEKLTSSFKIKVTKYFLDFFEFFVPKIIFADIFGEFNR